MTIMKNPSESQSIHFDIDEHLVQKINSIYDQLETLSHYQLLGVSIEDDRKTIKKAYYDLATQMHPDVYFGKNLGEYKNKIETLFSYMTKALDVLSNQEEREKYDEYLKQKSEIHQLENAIHSEVPTEYKTEPEIPKLKLSPDEITENRKHLLARKLLGNRFQNRTSQQNSSVHSSVQGAESTEGVDALDSFKFQFEKAKQASEQNRIKKILDEAHESFEKKDFVKATKLYKWAASIEPNNPEILKTWTQVQQSVSQSLADSYIRQGKYESNQGRWAEAALNYSKACEGRPDDAVLHEKVAICLLHVGQNLNKAVEFARKSVQLAPKSVDCHITLAKTYFYAGLYKSAKGELDRVIEIAPMDGRIYELMKQLENKLL